ncbi:hypothetical protein EHM69_04700 [candidate division KSB1 bacterium]|nr:MAG: hypothetical protein EHM69_04700 [candidate division KSB1 bacterium]
MKRTLIIVAITIIASTVFAAAMELTSARLYKKQGELLKSYQFYTEALRKEPGSLDAYFERGQLVSEIAADSTKADIAKQIAGDKPNPQLALYDLMLADFQEATTPRTSADESAVKKLRKKIDEILQERWTYFYFLGVQNDSSYMKAKTENVQDPDPGLLLSAALASLDMAIKILPDRWNAYGLEAQIYGKLGDRKKAADYWQLALTKIDASDMKKKEAENYATAIDVIHGNLLENYYNLDRFPETIELADAILAKDSLSMDAIQFKAFALARMASDTALTAEQRTAMKNEAITALNRAKAGSNDPVIIYYIGQFHLQLADTAAALASFKEYLKLDDKDREVRFAIGVIYLEGGSYINTELARDEYARLTELYPDDGAAWINYGIALIRLNNNVHGKEAVEIGTALRDGQAVDALMPRIEKLRAAMNKK